MTGATIRSLKQNKDKQTYKDIKNWYKTFKQNNEKIKNDLEIKDEDLKSINNEEVKNYDAEKKKLNVSKYSESIIRSTVKAWDKGKNFDLCKFPTNTSLLAAKNVFGKPSIKHTYTREAEFSTITCLIFKSGFLDGPSLKECCKAYWIFDLLWDAMRKLSTRDFSGLRVMRYDEMNKKIQRENGYFSMCNLL